MDHFTEFLNVFASGWIYPFDFSSPDEQSGAVCFSPGSWRQRKHTRQRRKVTGRLFFPSSSELLPCLLSASVAVTDGIAERVRQQNTAVFAKLVEARKKKGRRGALQDYLDLFSKRWGCEVQKVQYGIYLEG